MLDSAFGSAESRVPQLMWHGWGFLQQERQLRLGTQTKPVSLTMASLGMMAGLSQLLLQLWVSDTAEKPNKCSWL